MHQREARIAQAGPATHAHAAGSAIDGEAKRSSHRHTPVVSLIGHATACARGIHALPIVTDSTRTPSRHRPSPSRAACACHHRCRSKVASSDSSKLALLLGQTHGCFHHHAADQIAMARAAHRLDAATAQAELRAGLGLGGMLIGTSPSSVGTGSSAPSAACEKRIGSSQYRSLPSRWKIACSRTCTSTYRSPAGVPGGPASPCPLRRMRSPLSTPAGICTDSVRVSSIRPSP
jgi:hypothetical protein